VLIPIIHSCKKEEIPTLTTSTITNINATSAISGGSIISEGTGTINVKGVCWSTSTTPTISDNKTTDGAGAGAFTSNISGLDGKTTYYVRAYATNSAGTGYGNQVTFTTNQIATATLTTANVTSITQTTVVSGGTVMLIMVGRLLQGEYVGEQ
jgi:hypothetical protein